MHIHCYCVIPTFLGLKQMSFVLSELHPQQLNFKAHDISILIPGFAWGGRLQSGRFLGLSFKLVGDTPSTIPAVDADRMFFWFTALIFSSSAVLMLVAGD